MKSIAVVAIIFSASTAAAEPENDIEIDAMLGLSQPFIGVVMGGVSVGHRLHEQWWLRGQLSSGFGADDEGSGYIGQARIGGEARLCSASRIACFLPALDLGLEYATYNERDPVAHSTMTSFVGIPRLGIDIGGEQLRFRAAFELAFGLFGRVHVEGEPATTYAAQLIGGNIVVGFAVPW